MGIFKKAGRAFRKAGKKVKDSAKSIGSTVKNGAKKVGGVVKKTAKTTGRVVKNTAKSSGGVVKRNVKRATRTVKKTAKTTARVVKNTAKTTGRVVKNVAKKVTKTGNFNLNCHFLICHSQADFSDNEVEIWINERVKSAEKLYAMKPKLKIKSSFSRVKNGSEFLTMKFSSDKKYNSFMNKNFDNISRFFTSGRLNFLVANSWEIGGESPCGKAFFNFYPGWKKHAIYLRRKKSDGTDCSVATFPHELGHVFGLRHTFEKGGVCTSKYPKGEAGEGGTKKNGRSNLMDYGRANVVYINDCQQRVAALRRRRNMTITGKTKYYKLAGFV